MEDVFGEGKIRCEKLWMEFGLSLPRSIGVWGQSYGFRLAEPSRNTISCQAYHDRICATLSFPNFVLRFRSNNISLVLRLHTLMHWSKTQFIKKINFAKK